MKETTSAEGQEVQSPWPINNGGFLHGDPVTRQPNSETHGC